MCCSRPGRCGRGRCITRAACPRPRAPAAEKDAFVQLFYDKHIQHLLAALVEAGDEPDGPGAPAANTGALRGRVLQAQQLCHGLVG